MEQTVGESAAGARGPSLTGDTLEEWSAELLAVHERIAPRFARLGMRQRALVYLRGLLSGLDRKNGGQLAEFAGAATPDGMQDFRKRGAWGAAAVRAGL